jgi:hypothetical protein
MNHVHRSENYENYERPQPEATIYLTHRETDRYRETEPASVIHDRRHETEPAEVIHDRRRETRREGVSDRHRDSYVIGGRDTRRDSSRERVFDNDGSHYIIRGREREAEPTYANAQNTTSKYYEGGFGDRAWRKKKLERIGRRHPPRTDPKREPPQSSK